MKVIALACPNCGADIEAREGIRYLSCSHCGSSLAIEEGAGAVYAVLRRAADASARAADELRLARLRGEREAAREDLRDAEEALEAARAYREQRNAYLVVGFAGVVAFVAGLLLAVEWRGWLLLGGPALVIGAILAWTTARKDLKRPQTSSKAAQEARDRAALVEALEIDIRALEGRLK